MKKMMIAVLVATAAGAGYAHAENAAKEPRGAEMRGPGHAMRGEMRALIRGDGMDVAALANLMQTQAEAHFDRLDTDGDGVISREEFLAGVGERADRVFARMDRNEDGVVTRADRPHRMMRGEWRGEGRRGGGRDGG